MKRLRSTGISKEYLLMAYVERKRSMQQVANELHCSLNKIDYWMRKYDIPRRTRNDANYAYYNPNGDPFVEKQIMDTNERELFGLGIGLYWGEGTKASKNSVRIGNSDPSVILMFIKFLETIYSISRSKLKFGMQLFSDCDEEEALRYWCDKLQVDRSQFYKVHVTISGKIGTYRRKNEYGVVTLYYHNTRLQKILVDHISSMPR